MRISVLPVMSVLSVIAAAVGLQLGETTVAQIDPLYFEGAAPPPRDVTANAQAPRANAYATASGWAEGQLQPEQASATLGPSMVEAPLYAYSDPTIAPRWEESEAPLVEEATLVEPSAETQRVRRYLDYPVTPEQAETRAAAEKPKPAVQTLEPEGL